MVEKKAKVVPVTKLDGRRPVDSRVLELVSETIRESHPDLEDADIAVCWHHSWRADHEGRMKYAELRRTSPVDRALREKGASAGRDLTLVLNYDAFNKDRAEHPNALTPGMQAAWIDNALCAAVLVKDAEGYPKLDDHGEKSYRLKKPDVALFIEAYERHGPMGEAVADLRNAIIARQYEDKPLLALFDREPAERDAVTSG